MQAGAFLCGACIFTQCLHEFPLGSFFPQSKKQTWFSLTGDSKFVVGVPEHGQQNDADNDYCKDDLNTHTQNMLIL